MNEGRSTPKGAATEVSKDIANELTVEKCRAVVNVVNEGHDERSATVG
jgi:hypothetical protein